MRVLIIPEDFRKDQYVLKPIILAMLKALGMPRPNVRVCQDPLMGGVSQALNWENLAEVVDRYSGMVDLFLLCVDRDGEAGRRQQLDRIESNAADMLAADRLFLAENAWQELEVWVLAGHDLPSEWVWRDVRSDLDPKERYFIPFARDRGVLDSPGEGRKPLAEEAARRYDRIRQLCPEDIANLEGRIRAWASPAT